MVYSEMTFDPWLDRWLPLILERAAGVPILEIACGSGDDSATLFAAGLDLIAFDRSAEQVARARLRAPRAHIECRDIRDAFPAFEAAPGVIVASLCLHYFSWDETVSIVARIRQALRPGGILICRVNSTRDHNYGASGHPRIEPDYYRVDGEPKRFFGEVSVRRLFAEGWRYLSLEHYMTNKYPLPKAVWEVVVEREC